MPNFIIIGETTLFVYGSETKNAEINKTFLRGALATFVRRGAGPDLAGRGPGATQLTWGH